MFAMYNKMEEEKNTIDIECEIMPPDGYKWQKLLDGQPCSHAGCHAHRTHPCEVCKRVECKGETKILKNLKK